MSKANSSILVYRIPYQNLNSKEELFTIDNQFIVYILYGKNENDKDYIYVGKSKNGLKNRPTSHEDKYDKWTYCYVLTQFKERTFFNDGAIQYLENTLSNRITDLGYYNNTTKQTTAGTANKSDEEDCDEYLEEVYQMLDALGLDLITYKDEDVSEEIDDAECDDNDYVIPDGKYYLKRKIKRDGRTIKAYMQVVGGRYIVLKGSEICEKEGPRLSDSIIEIRKSSTIVDGKLYNDVSFNSLSAAGGFVVGSRCNGWKNWRCEDGSLVNKYRS